jgi:hypothetical protein
MTIWKYQLAAMYYQALRMPKGAEILHVDSQNGEDICLWAKVEEGRALEDREIYLYGTGHPISHQGRELKHLGTILIHRGDLVFHVFERLPHGQAQQGQNVGVA